ncbi:hypothetical protein [Ligilactobacillus pobuzihii]|uniref:Uncharacterized protein n=1 Tax=Ligilactobacillus pobuzihii TaxID=449659 RepID=A0A0R2L420_9LACO|nr:hypothetical protein [Ligilactobacillus pobuzihii]KRK09588.1 hypothetical protein FD11_GL000627 [Ligilactobacillus pobuzihii E100301 = KCTC 13174]KRN96504.1 hypothetical protein IV66_GL000689 [Ligilactobacillus pobuzihii]GEN48787.1 hypothetical protein LPO01_15790 [Ligilactobacillus pobuzihii]
MKKEQVFTILGGSVLLGLLMYRKQKRQQKPAQTLAKDNSLKAAVKNTVVSAKNLGPELKNTMGTIEEIKTEINQFTADIEPQLKKLTKDVEKFQK